MTFCGGVAVVKADIAPHGLDFVLESVAVLSIVASRFMEMTELV